MNFKQELSYRNKLKDPRWQKKRLDIMNRDNFKCRYCGDEKTSLQVHHLSYSGDPWESEDNQLITLCEHCHSFVEFCKKNNIQVVLPYKKIFHASEHPSFLMRHANPFEEERHVAFFSAWNGKTFLSSYALSSSFYREAIKLFDVQTIYDEETPF